MGEVTIKTKQSSPIRNMNPQVSSSKKAESKK